MEKFIRCEKWGMELYGRVEDDQIITYNAPYWADGEPTDQKIDIGEVELLCPIKPSKIICVGLNYHVHVEHSQSAVHPPEEPLIFMKPPSALIGPGDEIVYPKNVDRVDYEAELGVVIGKRGRFIPIEQADDFIFGFTCVNDVTARNLQKKDGQWTRAKGFDTFCPVGPHVVRGIDPYDLTVEAYLNGVRKQHGKTSDMIFSIRFLVAFISEVMTLNPGDLIATGTPQGIDPMAKGDEIEVRISEIGTLKNKIA